MTAIDSRLGTSLAEAIGMPRGPAAELSSPCLEVILLLYRSSFETETE